MVDKHEQWQASLEGKRLSQQPSSRQQPSLHQQSHLSLEELQQWQSSIEEANRHNIWCHCRTCDREWIASTHAPCECGSRSVEYIACWQFPDD
ncbi:MAG: hypothetical protein HC772_04120 [Leptolyngbyaceae cyanobacterium CRU_2_3]|nr:hypothetical protein [Leptolyngbyaceae cyanobacterium CRU_2_3]